MKSIGIVVLAVGGICLMLALGMDTSVQAGGFGRVNNIGLMNDKQNYIIISSVIAIAGLIISIFGMMQEPGAVSVQPQNMTGDLPSRKCPACAEQIRPDAVKCRYCGSQVEAVAQECGFCSKLISKPALPCSLANHEMLRESVIKDTACIEALTRRGYLTSETDAQ